MEEKTNRPKPSMILRHQDGKTTKVYVLDEGDSMPMNSSTNYDHHYQGAGIITVTEHRGRTYQSEYHVNDPNFWKWINSLANAGISVIKDMGSGEWNKFRKEQNDFIDKYPAIKSIHDKKEDK